MTKKPPSRDIVRVIAVSPGDVAAEGKRLRAVVDELDRGICRELGFDLQLWTWKTDAHPGLHLEGPQGLIDEAMRMEDADIVIAIFWSRLGTPTATAESGTAHELRRAWDLWKERERPQVYVYLSERKTMLKTVSEAAQQLALFQFRDSMPPEQMRWPYASLKDFEGNVRQHLTAHIMKLARAPSHSDSVAPSDSALGALQEVWAAVLSGAPQGARADARAATGTDDLELTDKLKDNIAEAIAALPDAEKLVIALTYYERLSNPEIAQLMTQPVRSVHRLHEQALERLRADLQRSAEAQ